MLIQNKNYKSFFLTNIIFIIFFLGIFSFLNLKIYQKYDYNNNYFLNQIIATIVEKYPHITKKEIVDLLNNSEEIDSSILKEYGINLNNSYVLKNSKLIKFSLFLNIFLIFGFAFIIFFNYLIYIKRRNHDLKEITTYLKEINQGNYTLKIEDNTEDYLSSLKNEIGKITIMLREKALLNEKDKLLLKTSLEDLSHQLKTPLTSITLMLDNLQTEADVKTKKVFIKDIKRLVLNINFLVTCLLKLAKFDANTITFKEEKFYLFNLISESIKNVLMLAELKNIEFIVFGKKKTQLKGDFKWQVEALTNILKNCIEYSYQNSKIEVTYEENRLYSKIIIRDYGIGIKEEDLKHLFERFYKGKNASSDSVGIGLALAKTIIEHSHGYINVESKLREGTTFIIKYIK